LKQSLILTPAFVLHYRPYSDSSLILELFTLDFGRITCIAKGVKKGKLRKAAILQPFIPLMISFSGKGEVKTLRDCESVENGFRFEGQILYSAYYINELLLKFLHKNDVYHQLFAIYANLLKELSNSDNTEIQLRLFEMRLLTEMGLALQLTHESDSLVPVNETKKYVYKVEDGPVEITSSIELQGNEVMVHGESLLALAQETFEKKIHLQEAKKLMRYVIKYHLDGYQFKSREFFISKF